MSEAARSVKIFTVPVSKISPKVNTDAIILPPYIALKGDNDLYLSRYNESPHSSDKLICFIKSDIDQSSIFKVHRLSDNKIALQADNGLWLSRYQQSEDSWPRVLAIKKNIDDACKFTIHLNSVESGAETKIYLQADNGYFLSRFDRDGYQYLDPVKPIADQYCLMSLKEVILQKEIVNINYKIDSGEITELDHLVALKKRVSNDTPIPQQTTLEYSYNKFEEGTWSNSAGVELGVETTFKAGVPFLAGGKITVRATTSYNHQWGGSQGKSETITDSTQFTLPPNSKGKVEVLVKQAVIDVPFSYTVKRTLLNGKTEIQEIDSGIYRNLESYFVDVKYFMEEP